MHHVPTLPAGAAKRCSPEWNSARQPGHCGMTPCRQAAPHKRTRYAVGPHDLSLPALLPQVLVNLHDAQARPGVGERERAESGMQVD